MRHWHDRNGCARDSHSTQTNFIVHQTFHQIRCVCVWHLQKQRPTSEFPFRWIFSQQIIDKFCQIKKTNEAQWHNGNKIIIHKNRWNWAEIQRRNQSGANEQILWFIDHMSKGCKSSADFLKCLNAFRLCRCATHLNAIYVHRIIVALSKCREKELHLH